MSNKEIKVKDCNSCPFKSYSWYYGDMCSIKKAGKNMSDKSILQDEKQRFIHPKWCPLKKKDVTIKLKNNEK